MKLIGYRRKRISRIILCFAVILFAVLAGYAVYMLSYYNLLPERSFSAEYFDITTVYSSVDYNKNGTDDYTDILLGARKDIKNNPRYDGRYYDTGYPPDNIGVCTDVVWRAFRNAGYCLRDMVDNDIKERPDSYPDIKERDNNIDFRRVWNLHTYFQEHAVSLTTDINDIAEWQPGDIVIFGDDRHIGIVSDKRNSDGQVYIIHNGGRPNMEEDYLKIAAVTAHYRFDASLLNESDLVAWHE